MNRGSPMIEAQSGKTMTKTSGLTFEQVRHSWSSIFWEPDDPDQAQMIEQLDLAACGFNHSIFYRGTRVQCDTLLQAASEQVAAMRSIRAFADRSSPMYFQLNSPERLLYMRHIPISSDLSSDLLTEGTAVYFVMLGPHQVVSHISSQLNQEIDTQMESPSTDFSFR